MHRMRNGLPLALLTAALFAAGCDHPADEVRRGPSPAPPAVHAPDPHAPPSVAAEPAPKPEATPRIAERLGILPGLENVGRVAPDLYRGSAPTDQGLDSLKRLGIRTVVNLRHYHGSTEEEGCRRQGMDYIRIALASSDAPDDADTRRFLEVATDPARRPLYFHCMRGKDRTGTMCAAYRMAVEGWPLEDALREMESFGFWSDWHDLRKYVEGLPARLDAIRPKPSPH